MGHVIFFLAVLLVLLVAIWRIQRTKLREYHSDILGLIEVWRKYNGEKILTINKYPHGISIEDKTISQSYWYAIAQQTLKHLKGQKNSEILFFGLGANTSSRLIAAENKTVHQTIIEIDPDIIDVCKEFFYLNETPNIKIVLGDAYKLIDEKKRFKNKFDTIIVDIFTGIPPYVSTKTNQPSFIQKMMKWLKKDGELIFNRPANILKDREDTKKLESYLKTLFKKVKSEYIHDSRGYQNDIVTASEKRIGE